MNKFPWVIALRLRRGTQDAHADRAADGYGQAEADTEHAQKRTLLFVTAFEGLLVPVESPEECSRIMPTLIRVD
jgi:hypothetical protein